MCGTISESWSDTDAYDTTLTQQMNRVLSLAASSKLLGFVCVSYYLNYWPYPRISGCYNTFTFKWKKIAVCQVVVRAIVQQGVKGKLYYTLLLTCSYLVLQVALICNKITVFMYDYYYIYVP